MKNKEINKLSNDELENTSKVLLIKKDIARLLTKLNIKK